MARLLIYGAYGYSGELVCQRALEQGLHPVLAGRDPDRLAALGYRLNLETRVFTVEQARDHLDEVGLVLNCAGPFVETAPPLMDACIERGRHYMDITGEIAAFEAAAARDGAAREAGVLLCPGAGFTAVPTDCLAVRLKKQLPSAERLTLAFDFGTQPSAGTARTALLALREGGRVRRNGELVRLPIGMGVRRIPFADGPRQASRIPWGDVFTAWHSTRIPNIDVFAAMPWWMAWSAWMSNGLRPVLKNDFLRRRVLKLADRLAHPPDESARAGERAQFWGEVQCPRGQRVTGTVEGPNVYATTAELAIEVALRCLRDGGGTGFRTPVGILGADFLDERPGYRISIGERL